MVDRLLAPQGLAAMRGLGAGLLAGSGYSPAPVSFGQALGGGLLGAEQTMQNQQRMALAQQTADQATAMQPLQMQLMQSQVSAAQREQQQQEALDAAIAGLPPSQQPLARLDPSAYVKAQATGGGPGGTSMDAWAINTLRAAVQKDELTPIEQQDVAAARQWLDRPTTAVDPMGRVITTTKQMGGVYGGQPAMAVPTPATAPTGTQVAPGVNISEPKIPPKRSGEEVGRIAGIQSGVEAVDEVSNAITPGGDLDTALATQLYTGLAMTPEAQNLLSAMTEAWRNKVYLQSGAQVTEDEAKSAVRQFLPNPMFDDAASAQAKLNRLRRFYELGAETMQVPIPERPALQQPSTPTRPRAQTRNAGVIPQVATQPAQPGPLGQIGQGMSADNPVSVQTPEEAAALPPGTYIRKPDGSLGRVK